MVKNKNTAWGVVIGSIVAIIVVLALVIAVGIASIYNSLVGLDEGVNTAWGNVQSEYQRRGDLIPNLVSTVQAYSDYEGEVLTEITQARASIGNAQTPEQMTAAGQELNSALARLLVVVESYPNLKANENFLDSCNTYFKKGL